MWRAVPLEAVRDPVLDPAIVVRTLRARLMDRELLTALDRVEDALAADHSPHQLASALGLARGVTGYVHHTVPVCLHAWLRSPHDFERVVRDVVQLGGDADTTGALAGALAGATVGAASLPARWLKILHWPRSVSWIRMLGGRVATIRSGQNFRNRSGQNDRNPHGHELTRELVINSRRRDRVRRLPVPGPMVVVS
jgi:ADP-ribosylglycohydrolase